MTNETSLTKEEIEKLQSLSELARKKLIRRPIFFFFFLVVIFMIPGNLLPSRMGRTSSTSTENIYEMFGYISPIAWALLLTGLLVLITVHECYAIEIIKDLKEKKKTIKEGLVDRVGSYKGEHYVKLQSGKPKFLRSHEKSFNHLKSGDKLNFEVYKNSRILIRILDRS